MAAFRINVQLNRNIRVFPGSIDGDAAVLNQRIIVGDQEKDRGCISGYLKLLPECGVDEGRKIRATLAIILGSGAQCYGAARRESDDPDPLRIYSPLSSTRSHQTHSPYPIHHSNRVVFPHRGIRYSANLLHLCSKVFIALWRRDQPIFENKSDNPSCVEPVGHICAFAIHREHMMAAAWANNNGGSVCYRRVREIRRQGWLRHIARNGDRYASLGYAQHRLFLLLRPVLRPRCAIRPEGDDLCRYYRTHKIFLLKQSGLSSKHTRFWSETQNLCHA